MKTSLFVVAVSGGKIISESETKIDSIFLKLIIINELILINDIALMYCNEGHIAI